MVHVQVNIDRTWHGLKTERGDSQRSSEWGYAEQNPRLHPENRTSEIDTPPYPSHRITMRSGQAGTKAVSCHGRPCACNLGRKGCGPTDRDGRPRAALSR